MSDNFNKNRILKNSLFLYLRMLFTMGLNLWATRLVLANLGMENMGVYGVVGSIVGMFAVLTGGVTTAVQRFITYEIGRNKGNVNRIFCSSLNAIFILSTFLLLLLEVVGLWMLYNNKLNIPVTSLEEALWVFQLSVFTCIVNLISIPYNALLIAKEKMRAFAFISILQVILSCIVAYSLVYFQYRLIWYAVLTAFIGLLNRIIYQLYCVRKFDEAKYHFILDKNEILGMMKFTGVSTVSGIFQVISAQGVVFIINWCFGVALNAVYVISLQLKNAVLSFSLNIFKAISPQITKTYASGELEVYKKLVYTGSRIEVFMIYFIMIPFLFRTDYIMYLWLGEIPEYVVVFTQCTVFLSLTYAAFEPIRTAVYATNRITKFMIIPEIAYCLVLPIGYLVGKYTENPSLFMLSVVGLDMLNCLLRIYFAVQVSVLKVADMMKRVLIPVASVAIVSSIICYLLTLITSETLIGLLMLLVCNSLSLFLIIYLLGINSYERKQVNGIIRVLFLKSLVSTKH